MYYINRSRYFFNNIGIVLNGMSLIIIIMYLFKLTKPLLCLSNIIRDLLNDENISKNVKKIYIYAVY